jgi:Holliday junction resolvase RusA-like endonuclease
LKLARAAEDALTQVIWRDDSQIVSEVLLKVYADSNPARLEVTIRPMNPDIEH